MLRSQCLRFIGRGGILKFKSIVATSVYTFSSGFYENLKVSEPSCSNNNFQGYPREYNRDANASGGPT